MFKLKCVLALAVILVASEVAAAASANDVPTNAYIRGILADRVDTYRYSVGTVVGVIEPQGRRIVSYGRLDQTDPRAPDGDTIFEIGSITKVFTSLLLADMTQRGETSLTEPVASLLPSEVSVPQRGGRSILLRDLAWHISGLPRMPTNLADKDDVNPFADYSVQQLYSFLSHYELTRDIGAEYEYSNLGVGLLGHALARRAGMDYEALVSSRILYPLGMLNTRIALTAEMNSRLAPGHDETLARVPNWDWLSLGAAGALRSSASDLLTFLGAELGDVETRLAPAMSAMLSERHAIQAPSSYVALGWHIEVGKEREIVWHGGATKGYRSFIGFDPSRHVGVVILSNAGVGAVEDIGFHLLGAGQLAKLRPQVPVDTKRLDDYVGFYELPMKLVMTISREGDQLFAQLTDQQKFPVFPERDREFFYKTIDAQISFQSDGFGPASKMLLHQYGRDIVGSRIAQAPLPRVSKAHFEVALSPAVLDGYTGRYELEPNMVMTVVRDGNHLLAQITGQPALEILPESTTNFFYKAIDAQITFNADSRGRAMSFMLHQYGTDIPAPKIAEAPVEGPIGDRKEVLLDPQLLDLYVGRYQLGPNLTLSVTRQGSQLFAQITGQPSWEVFAEGEREFFYKAVDAQLVFFPGETGRARSVILHQGRRDHPAMRISDAS